MDNINGLNENNNIRFRIDKLFYENIENSLFEDESSSVRGTHISIGLKSKLIGGQTEKIYSNGRHVLLRRAIYMPISYTYHEILKEGITLFEPTYLFSVLSKNEKFEYTISPRVLINLSKSHFSGSGVLPCLDIGVGFSPNPSKWMFRMGYTLPSQYSFGISLYK